MLKILKLHAGDVTFLKWRFHQRQLTDAHRCNVVDAFSSNTLISDRFRAHRATDAIDHFKLMLYSQSPPDNFTYSIILPYVDISAAIQLHARILKIGWKNDVFVCTNLLKAYAEAGHMIHAKAVFDEMPEKDLVSWNAMISCYSKFGFGRSSLRLFKEMVDNGVKMDEYTVAIVLNELASRLLLHEGTQVHCLMIRCGFGYDRFASNALLDLYSKAKCINSSKKLFDEMTVHDVVSWTAMITGYLSSGDQESALEAFGSMLISEVEPNSFTFGVLLSSCANTCALERGKLLHAFVIKYGLEEDAVTGSALVDMYSNCGKMNHASKIFYALPEKDIVCWNGMICGLAQNGDFPKALQLFDEMSQLHNNVVAPNVVTFVGVLTACSHGGFVEEARYFFNKMVNRYSIDPRPEHYTCMIDTLARAGLVEAAESLIISLPFKPDNIMLGALLGACKRRGNTTTAKRVARYLFDREPRNSSNYVLLANLHSNKEEWGDALEVREVMSRNGAQKVMGSSWIEIRGLVHCFASGRITDDHQPSNMLYEVLQGLRFADK